MFWNVTNALLEGMGTTMELFALTLLFSLPLGLLVAFGSMSKWAPLVRLLSFCGTISKWKPFHFLAKIASSPKWSKTCAKIRPIKLLVDLVVWVIRGTPLMLQLMVICATVYPSGIVTRTVSTGLGVDFGVGFGVGFEVLSELELPFPLFELFEFSLSEEDWSLLSA